MTVFKFFDTTKGDVAASVPAAVGGNPSGTPYLLSGFSNLTATTDPGPTNDTTQGYVVGSIWYNSTFLRTWQCHSNAAGAAGWVYEGADYANGGLNPNSESSQFGSSIAGMAEEGNIYRLVSAGFTPVATGSDIVLASYAIPANAFDVAGRGITITAQGSFGGTTNNKRIKIIIGTGTLGTVGSVVPANGTVIGDTGTVSTNGSGFVLTASVFKYGAAGSNTQVGLHQQSQVAGSVTPLVATSALANIENQTINIAITANCTTLGNDVTLSLAEVNAVN